MPGLTRDVGRLFLGMDLQCAQCHNHLRIDDYKQVDFQGLFVVFQNSFIRSDVKFPAIGENVLKKKQDFMSVFDKVPHAKEILYVQRPARNSDGKYLDSMAGARLHIVKGSKNKDLAMKVLAKFVSPDLQANLPLYVDNGPANEKAFETGKIPQDRIKDINSAPENVKKQVLQDPAFWRDTLVEATEKFNNLIQQ